MSKCNKCNKCTYRPIVDINSKSSRCMKCTERTDTKQISLACTHNKHSMRNVQQTLLHCQRQRWDGRKCCSFLDPARIQGSYSWWRQDNNSWANLKVLNIMRIFIRQTNMVAETIITAQTKKSSKLTSNLDTRLAHNTLGKEKSKYYWQYFTVSILSVEKFHYKNSP